MINRFPAVQRCRIQRRRLVLCGFVKPKSAPLYAPPAGRSERLRYWAAVMEEGARLEYIVPISSSDGVWGMVKRVERFDGEEWLVLFKGELSMRPGVIPDHDIVSARAAHLLCEWRSLVNPPSHCSKYPSINFHTIPIQVFLHSPTRRLSSSDWPNPVTTRPGANPVDSSHSRQSIGPTPVRGTRSRRFSATKGG